MNGELQRRVPFSLEAEQSLIASIMIDPSCIDVVSETVSSDDFYQEEHAALYRIMLSMYSLSRNIDIVTLLDEIKKSEVFEGDTGKDYLKLIAGVVPTAANAADYARIVREKAVLRRLIEAGENISEKAYLGEENADKLVEYAESQIYSIAEERSSKSFVQLSDLLVSVHKHLEEVKENPEASRGTSSSFSALDNVIVGLFDSDLILVGARPSMGKTAFAMNIATAVARKTKKPVCIFSLEMAAEQIVTRLLSSEALVDSYKMRSGKLDAEEWENIARTAVELAKLDIRIDDTAGISIGQIRAKMRRVKDPALVVVDYLQLISADDGGRRQENRVNEVGAISRGLKQLAKEIGAPVLCCAQLSRSPESRPDKRPMLSDLRESGQIEQDADVVLFLYRDEYYKDKKDNQSTAEVIVAKNRHGAVGKVTLGFIGQYTKFVTLANENEG
ncbi:MAG: replicative DNA helicase [Clostridia bacterium]|nr:replicative DNA helicase [Clostridia bacterium]MBR3415493.1 replicative DNA helicase [Clostridia bacterium]